MSTNKPNLYGGQQRRGATSVIEARIGNPNSALAYNSNLFQVLANVKPGSLTFNRPTSQVEIKHGVTASTHERHMSERSSEVSMNFEERTGIVRELANMSSIGTEWTQATTGFTQSTIAASGNGQQVVTLQSASGLTVGDLLLFIHNAGTLDEFQEEKFVQSVSSNKVTLAKPLSQEAAAASLVKRLVDVVQRDGGGDYKERTLNFKASADDRSVFLVHYYNGVISTGNSKLGSNNEVMNSDLTFSANSQPYTFNNASVPVFSECHEIPPNEAINLT